MTFRVVPTGADPFARQTTTFEGVTFVLSLAYNTRCACWYVSIADANGVDVVNGIKLVCSTPLLRKCADPRKPAGDLMVLSSSVDTSPPDLPDLLPSGRCKLLYVTSDWLTQLRAGNVADLLALVASNALAATDSAYGADAAPLTSLTLGGVAVVSAPAGPRGFRGLAGPPGLSVQGPQGLPGTAGAFTMGLGSAVTSSGTDATLPKRVGGLSWNPANYPGLTATSTIVLHALLESTIPGDTANLQLVRATGTGAPAVLATVSTNSTTSTEMTFDVSAFFGPGQSPGLFFANVYLSVASTTNVATCSGAWLLITP